MVVANDVMLWELVIPLDDFIFIQFNVATALRIEQKIVINKSTILMPNCTSRSSSCCPNKTT